MTTLFDATAPRQFNSRVRPFGYGIARPTRRPSDRPSVLDDAQRLAMLHSDPAEDAAIDARYAEIRDEDRYQTGSWAF